MVKVDAIGSTVCSCVLSPHDALLILIVEIELIHLSHDRRISGVMFVPFYLSSVLPGSYLIIDNATGLPVYQGITDVTFTVSH